MARSLIAYQDGLDAPRTSPFTIAEELGLDEVSVMLGWHPEHLAWFDDERLTGATYMAGYGLAQAVAAGRIRFLPIRLSAVPRHLVDDPPAVAVVTGVPRGDGFAFGSTVGLGPAMARAAARVVIEVDHEGLDLGGPMIDGNVVATVSRPTPEGPPPTPRPPDETDLLIGATVASLLPPDASISLGPGGIAEAIARGIERPVRVWTGLITETTAGLHHRGLLNGAATAGYAWGRDRVMDLHEAGLLHLTEVGVTHDLGTLSSIPRFVACNTALQVGLDGSCNVDTVRGRAIAGIGGHADFATGAARSPGGLSLIALRSTTSSGRSTLVPGPERVSTPRADIDIVVTEHGIADLRGADDADRARRIVAIAAPEHRDDLRAALA